MKEIILSVASAAMSNVWGKTPRFYQSKAITRLLQMHCAGQKLSLMILIQGAGSVKSTLPQTVGVVTYGVTRIIENILCLGSDQQSNLNTRCKLMVV